MKLAIVERKIDVGRNVQAAKMLIETAGFENGHQADSLDPRPSRPASLAEVTISPSGATRTVATSSRPITTSAYWLPYMVSAWKAANTASGPISVAVRSPRPPTATHTIGKAPAVMLMLDGAMYWPQAV